jgi:cobalt-precorrin 5A hydrolase
VRAIAPYVRDKLTDPAVVSVDEGGAFAVPLLSGHVGGANDLARQVAALCGGVAAISTATDVNGLFAVDQWAARQGLVLGDRGLAKAVSAALLAGEPVGFASAFPVEGALPAGLTEGEADLGIWVTPRTGPCPFRRTLTLIPRCLTLGIGCRRGKERAAIAAQVDAALADGGYDRRAVRQVATVDRKGDEPGLLAFCAELGVPLVTHSPQALAAVEGEFASSDFVRSVVGVDNVCQRAAALAGGTLVLPRRAGDGVTVAAALREPKLSFKGE